MKSEGLASASGSSEEHDNLRQLDAAITLLLNAIQSFIMFLYKLKGKSLPPAKHCWI
jgi:hypothetical protein